MASITEDMVKVDLNNIQFSDIFVLEEIQQLQDDFSNATGVASIITNPEGLPITKPSNFCKLCNEIIRNTDKGRMNCFRSDAILGRQNINGPIVRTCLSGDLWDAGASITVGGKHIANWLIGQVKNERSNLEHMMKYADEIGADKEEYYKALHEIPVMSFERFTNVANMLFKFSNELSEKAYSNLLLKNQILEREEITARLFKSEEKYRMLVENCHDAIFTLDKDGIITFLSPVWSSIVGFPIEFGIGKSFKEFIHPDDIPLFQSYLDDLTEVRTCATNLEYRVRHSDGVWHLHATGGLPIKDEKNRVIGFYGAARDISDRKEAEAEIRKKNEELLKANAVKDKFFSIIAHDLKSPFSSILGLSRILSEDMSDFSTEQIQHIADNIHMTAENLYRLLENLLQWAKVQQNLIIIEKSPVALYPALKESLDIFCDSLKSKNLKVGISVPEDQHVYADRNILQIIVRNLISNAVKFTPRDGRIEISTRDAGENFVEISIKDTGIGMSQDLISNLFRPDVSTGRKGTDDELSTGLGLLLCKEFVEKQGGVLSVESECGKGSNFYFTVPNIFSIPSVDEA